MKSQNTLIAAFSVFLFAACTNETESDLLDQNIPNTITYTNSIKSIMDNNCISCHGTNPVNGASISLTTYQKVKDAVINKGLIDKISKNQDAAGMMPYGGTRLPQSTIDQVIAWKNTGFKE
jgi:mono/diheme cytochrome c family protein